MGAIKLKKHGNSYGFTVPSGDLNEANFDIKDEFEMIVSRNSITFIKRKPHHTKWRFEDRDLSTEDKKWLSADLGDIDE